MSSFTIVKDFYIPKYIFLYIFYCIKKKIKIILLIHELFHDQPSCYFSELTFYHSFIYWLYLWWNSSLVGIPNPNPILNESKPVIHGILVYLGFSLTKAFCSVSKYLHGLYPHFLQVLAQISPYKKKITVYKIATSLLLLKCLSYNSLIKHIGKNLLIHSI